VFSDSVLEKLTNSWVSDFYEKCLRLVQVKVFLFLHMHIAILEFVSLFYESAVECRPGQIS